ncbi:MAG: hypothetical protein AAFQ09_11135 [Pseudomonadota bacterium]
MKTTCGVVIAMLPGQLSAHGYPLGDPVIAHPMAFEAGEAFQATLVFAKAGEIDIVFHVEARPDDASQVHHSNH